MLLAGWLRGLNARRGQSVAICSPRKVRASHNTQCNNSLLVQLRTLLAVTPWSAQIKNLAAADDLRGINFMGVWEEVAI
jgi:hypothetical protein